MKSQIFGNFSDKKTIQKIHVLDYLLNDESYPVSFQTELHREVLELFALEGRSCRQISRALKAKYPEQATSKLRRNAKSNFGHEGISRIVNRYYEKAVKHYREKYEAIKADNTKPPEEY